MLPRRASGRALEHRPPLTVGSPPRRPEPSTGAGARVRRAEHRRASGSWRCALSIVTASETLDDLGYASGRDLGRLGVRGP